MNTRVVEPHEAVQFAPLQTAEPLAPDMPCERDFTAELAQVVGIALSEADMPETHPLLQTASAVLRFAGGTGPSPEIERDAKMVLWNLMSTLHGTLVEFSPPDFENPASLWAWPGPPPRQQEGPVLSAAGQAAAIERSKKAAAEAGADSGYGETQ